jgi:di/tricarboxylate transporter
MATIDAPISALDRAEPQTSEHHDEGLGRNVVLAGQVHCVLVPLAIWFAPLDLEPQTKHAFAIVGFMVIAWITQAMDYALAGFIGCFLFWALGIVRFPVAFSGFANDTA